MRTWQWYGAALVLATVYCSIIDAQMANRKPQSLIDNFQEVSNDIYTGVTFSFDLFKGDSGGITTRDVVQLRWETANSSSRGFTNLSVRTTAVANRYRFTVQSSQLGEDPLLLTLSIKLQCMRYNSYYCSLNQIRNRQSCVCVQWLYQGDSETIQIDPKQGDFDVVNFRDVTTDGDFMRGKVVFEFDVGPEISLRQSLRYQALLTWSEVSGNQSGTVLASRTPSCTFLGESYGQLERVGQIGTTYRLSVPLILLGEGRLLVKLTVNLGCSTYSERSGYHRYLGYSSTCTCSKWQVRGRDRYLTISAKQGDFDLVNFRDVTTESDLKEDTGIFEFEFDPLSRVNLSLGYDMHLTWSQINGSQSGVIVASSCSSYESQGRLERVGGTGTYRVSFPLHLLGEGRLLMNVTANLTCLAYQYINVSQCTCDYWQITGSTDLDMRAERGVQAQKPTVISVKTISANTTVSYKTPQDKTTVSDEISRALITNFREVTTLNSSIWNVVAFSFDLFSGDSNNGNITNRDIIQLQWETANSSRGLITVRVTNRNLYQGNQTSDSAVRYHFTVNAEELGEGPLQLTLSVKLQCLHYTNSYCNRYTWSWCTCSRWRYEGESETIPLSMRRGDFDITNFTDVTTENDLYNNSVIFEFEFDPLTPVNSILAYNIHLAWSQVSGPRSGTIAVRRCRYYYSSTSGQLERVGNTGTYRLSVPLGLLGEGRLLVNMTVNIGCNRFRYSYSCGCYKWQVRASSESLEISAKRGDFDVINFRDVTTENDLNNNSVIFEFEFDPLTLVNTILGYNVHLTWSQVSGPRSGTIAVRRCRYYYSSTSGQLERVGNTGTYRLSVPLGLLGEGRLLVNMTVNIGCNRNQYRYSCSCYQWHVRGNSEVLEISAKRDTVTIVNLRDITTQSDLEDKNAVFAFDIHPKLSPILALGYSAEIQWTVLKEEFGVSQRLQFFYVPPEVKNCRPLSNTTLEPVGTGSYNLTVDVAKIGAGPLSISVSVHFACLDSSSYRRCYYCSQWRYTSQMSSKIDISAKRGSLAPFEIVLELWSKEQCFEAADAIRSSDVSSVLINAIREHSNNATDTSTLQVYGERFLCEHKGYLTFRGVLIKTNDFLATKNLDILGDWLKGGARYIVVAERQMNIKEGACGLALTSLEDPACDKGVRVKGKGN